MNKSLFFLCRFCIFVTVVNVDVLLEVFVMKIVCCIRDLSAVGWLCRHTLGRCWFLLILSNSCRFTLKKKLINTKER